MKDPGCGFQRKIPPAGTVPTRRPSTERVSGRLNSGAANGTFALSRLLAEAHRAGGGTAAPPRPSAPDESYGVEPAWPRPGAKGRQWIDFQNDVTVKDIELAARENFRSVEHLKRYTTLGMATDQGKTSNMNGLAAMAVITGRSIAEDLKGWREVIDHERIRTVRTLLVQH